MSVSALITLDTRRLKKKTSKYPVKLLVTFEREPRRYQTIYDLSQEDYNKLSAPRISDKLQEIRKRLGEIESSAAEAINKLDPFTFAEFEKVFVSNNSLFLEKKI